MAEKIKRRQYPIVDRELQYKLFALILIYGVIIVLFFGVSLFVPDILDMMNEQLSLEVRAAAAAKILSYHSKVWPTAIALVCLIGIHSVRIFHRFIGPLYVFRLAFDKLRGGDLSFRVKLREKDYLHKEEGAFNEMIEGLKEKWESAHHNLTDALESLGSLERAVTRVSGWRDVDQQILDKQRGYLEALADNIQYFNVKGEMNQERDMVRRSQNEKQVIKERIK
ncbi:MAG: methyl-accepting chemotaxis protein [Deltaproteobacteria bacterium]|nr:methyl-accepting chemotaxis protein [Deltaproteobacteria bacterium]